MYVVMFNGPPKCGKDSIATAMATLLDQESDTPVLIDHYIRPLREAAMSLAGYDPKDFALYNRIKDEPQPLLQNDSIRTFMIYLSERAMKYKYGKDFWGRKLIMDRGLSPSNPGICLIPDLGFIDEGCRVMQTVTAENTLIVRVSRKDVGWKNDSRGYVNLGCKTIELNNDHLIVDAAERVINEMHRLGWQF